ncbi:MAG: hypothetical protein ABI832_02105 [bacterium]
MFRNLIAAAMTTVLLSTASYAAFPDPIAKVNVSVDLASVTNKPAADRYVNLSADLNAAITTILKDRLGSPGAEITVDISAVELSNSFTDAAGLADTHLVGLVNINDTVNNANTRSFELTIDVNTIKGLLPADTDMATMTASGDLFYHTMVDAFAQNLVAEMDK